MATPFAASSHPLPTAENPVRQKVAPRVTWIREHKLMPSPFAPLPKIPIRSPSSREPLYASTITCTHARKTEKQPSSIVAPWAAFAIPTPAFIPPADRNNPPFAPPKTPSFRAKSTKQERSSERRFNRWHALPTEIACNASMANYNR